jgi:hypothetical protein
MKESKFTYDESIAMLVCNLAREHIFKGVDIAREILQKAGASDKETIDNILLGISDLKLEDGYAVAIEGTTYKLEDAITKKYNNLSENNVQNEVQTLINQIRSLGDNIRIYVNYTDILTGKIINNSKNDNIISIIKNNYDKLVELEKEFDKLYEVTLFYNRYYITHNLTKYIYSDHEYLKISLNNIIDNNISISTTKVMSIPTSKVDTDYSKPIVDYFTTKYNALWISPSCIVYGGNGNKSDFIHILTAEAILNEAYEDCCRQLELEGFIKITNDNVYADCIPTDNQLHLLHEYFVKHYGGVINNLNNVHDQFPSRKLLMMDKLQIKKCFKIC